MKIILFLSAILISISSVSQEIKWKLNYIEATAEARTNSKNIIIFFVDGNKRGKELLIEKSIFSSALFKSEKDHFVLLKIDETNSDSLSVTEKRYNNRIIDAFNPKRKFPSFLVTDKNATEQTKLFKRFSKSRIKKIKEKLKNLN
jgi:hypothetical protein